MSFSLCRAETRCLALHGEGWAAQTQMGWTSNMRENISKCPPGILLLYHWTSVVSVCTITGREAMHYSLYPVESRCVRTVFVTVNIITSFLLQLFLTIRVHKCLFIGVELMCLLFPNQGILLLNFEHNDTITFQIEREGKNRKVKMWMTLFFFILPLYCRITVE